MADGAGVRASIEAELTWRYIQVNQRLVARYKRGTRARRPSGRQAPEAPRRPGCSRVSPVEPGEEGLRCRAQCVGW